MYKSDSNSFSKNIIELKNITKDFIGVRALDDVSLSIKKGEIHAIVGENGAGKSTLIKLIAGAHDASTGTIEIDGKQINALSPQEAIQLGIGVVYQEFNLFQNLKIYQNIFFGIEIRKKSGLLDHNQMIEKSKDILHKLKVEIDPSTKVSELTTAYQQIVEICKCLVRDSELIIMDEPSAPLTESEVDTMFEIVKNLNMDGVSIIYISHKLNEVFELADRVSILRDGKLINTLDVSETSEENLISLMVGRKIENIYPKPIKVKDEIVLSCNNINSQKIKNIGFELYKGEILGIGGLIGAGRTELIRLLFGADKISSGEIFINGVKENIKSPNDAIRKGIGFVPEDRKKHGIILNKSIMFNILLPNIERFIHKKTKMVNFKSIKSESVVVSKKLSIKYSSIDQLALYLSGGNQQKVIIAKWLLRDSDILILDEPTRGIDVGSKQEIYRIINQLVEMGKSIILISSEMPELIGLSNRIIVMHNGRVTGSLDRSEFSQERILGLASK